MVYYNEFDSKAAAWLRELINDGLIAHGEVDERSIVDVKASDLKGFTQCHFFAGIGGWSYALRLAGWSDEFPIWTASLPCQPFSAAGKGLGKSDERHLLPHFIELVRKCKPDTVFGEQVEGAIKHGWLDDLQTNMEAEGYAVGHCVLGAHSIGATHIRQRLYWVADNCRARCEEQPSIPGISRQTNEGNSRKNFERGSRMGDSKHNGYIASQIEGSNAASIRECQAGTLSSIIDWLYCRDNKYRPVKSGIKPLVNGIPRGMVHSSDPFNTQEARTVRLKGYGNAIVPQVAAEFIKAFMSCKR